MAISTTLPARMAPSVPERGAPRRADGMDRRGLERLLAATAGGDAEAFERLYRATSAKVFGICLRLLQERSDAEDVLQEVYALVWRKAAHYDPRIASPISWLAMVAHNKAIDRLRAQGPGRQALPLDLAPEIADPAAVTHAVAEQAADRRRIRHCLDQLEPRRRALIRAAFFDGDTYATLAQRSGVPLGTVKSWIRRGLAQLRECLDA